MNVNNASGWRLNQVAKYNLETMVFWLGIHVTAPITGASIGITYSTAPMVKSLYDPSLLLPSTAAVAATVAGFSTWYLAKNAMQSFEKAKIVESDKPDSYVRMELENYNSKES